VEDFWRHKSKPDGRAWACKACVSADGKGKARIPKMVHCIQCNVLFRNMFNQKVCSEECRKLHRSAMLGTWEVKHTNHTREKNLKWRLENSDYLRVYRVAYRIKNHDRIVKKKQTYYAAVVKPRNEDKNRMKDQKLELGIALLQNKARAGVSDVEAAMALRHVEKTAKYAAWEREKAIAASSTVVKYTPKSKEVAKRQAKRRATAKVILSLYDTMKLGTKSVGDVWYSELIAIRSESVFAASLADQIMKHARPSGPARVRDIVNEKTLAKMVARARSDVSRGLDISVKKERSTVVINAMQ